VPPLAVPVPPWVEPAPVAAGLLAVEEPPEAGLAAVLPAGADFTRVSVFTAVPAAGLADWFAVVPDPPAAFWFAVVF
jgi:hypothetical protein